jgi:hypothetical protein
MPPAPFDFGVRWREIEAAVDERLAELRARMLEDVDLASQVADIDRGGARDRPVRPHCGSRVEPRKRQVRTYHGKTLALRRSYTVYLTCQVAFSPI